MTPKQIDITDLGKIPEWSNIFDTQDEAQRAAEQRGQSYYFYCPSNHTWYVGIAGQAVTA